MIDRRSLLARSSLLAAGAAMPWPAMAVGTGARGKTPALIDDIEERTFRFFWDTTNPANGLAPDRWPTESFCSIAAIGFALTAYPIGVARGWITREQARARTVTTLRFLWTAPQGPEATGVAGYKGFFYHFLDMATGHRFRNVELSSVDTTLLLGGILFAREWFDAPEEREIRELADKIYARCDWRWFQDRLDVPGKDAGDARVSMGWTPEKGFIERRWFGYTEAMLLYVLGLASPTHPLGGDPWAAWCATYPEAWRGEGGLRHLAFAPHFGHQYSHVWIDFRGIRDGAMRQAGFDYHENSRRATLTQRAYAIRNPRGFRGYGADVWGLTACDGPGDFERVVAGRPRRFIGYSARGPEGLPDGGNDDGTIAPTAALGSIAFAPDIVVPAATAMHRRYGTGIYGKYGFFDAFNPTLQDGPVAKGRVVRGVGWVDTDYLGIDQGPIVAMIANHKDELVWRAMRRSVVVRRGLAKAGFTGGWL